MLNNKGIEKGTHISTSPQIVQKKINCNLIQELTKLLKLYIKIKKSISNIFAKNGMNLF